MLFLVAAAHHHEGVSAILRRLHPSGQPWPTAGLAAAVLSDVRADLADGALVRAGALVVDGEGPWPDRTLRLAPLLWERLAGLAAARWPAGCDLDRRPAPPWGLGPWLADPAVEAVVAAVQRRETILGAVTGDRPGPLASRLAAAVLAAGATPVVLHAPAVSDSVARQVALAALVDDVVPVLWAEGPAAGPLPLIGLPGPVLVAVHDGLIEAWPRPVVRLPAGPLAREDRLDLAAAALPALAPSSTRSGRPRSSRRSWSSPPPTRS